MKIEITNETEVLFNQIKTICNKGDDEIIKNSLILFYDNINLEKYLNNNQFNFNDEIWKDIPNYEGYYQASNLGRIKSLDRILTRERKNNSNIFYKKPGRIFRLRYHFNRRYFFVRLSKNSKTSSYAVHRIIAQTFLPNPNNLPQVNHINGVKSDNRIENLKWVDGTENIKHAISTGLIKPSTGENHGSSILTNEIVLKMREMFSSGNFKKIQIARKFNLKLARVCEIINRKTWKHI